MSKLYLNNFSEVNLYKKMSTRSEVTTQMIYGDSFSIIKKKNNWFKIKIKEDGYVGFVKKRNYHNYKKPSHKVSVIFAKTYKEPNFRNLSGKLEKTQLHPKVRQVFIVHLVSNFIKISYILQINKIFE